MQIKLTFLGGAGNVTGSKYIVEANGIRFMVDCGLYQEREFLKRNWEDFPILPNTLDAILLTHAHVDHIGSAAQIKAETGCRIVAHANDAPAVESGDPAFTVASLYGVDLQGVKPDHLMKGEEETLQFEAGELKLIHTPGHTPGSMVAVYETGEERILFGQDVHGPFSPAFGSDIEAWRQSMQKLLDLKADVLCEGHFGVFRPASEVERFIREQLASHKPMMPEPIPL